MRKLKILLSADWHLDSPWEALSSRQAREMRRTARSIPRRLARIAAEEKADLILLAGDLFDLPRPYPESLRELERAFEGLDIPVFIVPGNHDCFGEASLWDELSLPDNVYLFRRESLECVSLPFANIYGAAFTEPVRRCAPELKAGTEARKYHILLLHADVDGTGAYMPVSRKALADSGFHFAALGHIHRPGGLNRDGGTWWCYPGCPMGRGFDECGSRGAMLISLSDEDCSAEFLELSDRRYEKTEVCVTGRDPYEALSEAVFAAEKENICRFELTGRCENPPGQSHLAALAERRGLYAAFLKDSTLPPAHTGGVSLKNTLLKTAEERMALPDANRDEINAALKWALAALEGAEAPEEVAE